MKKLIFLSILALSHLLSSCNSCGSRPEGVIIENDSIFMINDSTVGDLQTFIFEGPLPMTNGNVGDVVLTMQTLSLNEDGTYTITTDYIDEGLATENDNGDMFVIIGMPNDSTAVIYELVSATGKPKMNFMLSGDTALVKLDAGMQPASKHASHRLIHKK